MNNYVIASFGTGMWRTLASERYYGNLTEAYMRAEELSNNGKLYAIFVNDVDYEDNIYAIFHNGQMIAHGNRFFKNTIHLGQNTSINVMVPIESEDPDLDFMQPMLVNIDKSGVGVIHPEHSQISNWVDFWPGKPRIYLFNDYALEHGGDPQFYDFIDGDWDEFVRRFKEQ